MITLLLSLIASWGQGSYEVPDMPVTPFTSSDYNFEVIDCWPYGSGFSVLRDGDYLFYTNGAVLQIGEVSSSGEVFWLSEIIFPGMAYTCIKSNSRLYVAIDDRGIAIVDVLSLNDPQLLNLFSTGGRVFGPRSKRGSWRNSRTARARSSTTMVLSCSRGPARRRSLWSLTTYSREGPSGRSTSCPDSSSRRIESTARRCTSGARRFASMAGGWCCLWMFTMP